MKIPVGRIPKYVAASSLKGLRRAMLLVQIKLGYGVEFTNFQKEDGKWLAFYYDAEDISENNPQGLVDDK